MQSTVGSSGEGKQLLQHKCRKGRKRAKLRHPMSRSVLHNGRKGVRASLDSPVVGPMFRQHINDTNHVHHRHGKVQVS